jgi:pimeloyl-ACP methyl ester carboxylesterase
MYGAAVPRGWTVLEPPTFKASGGRLRRYVDWLRGELDAREEPVVVAGHSMGGALCILSAAAEPSAVSRLVLVSPAGFPLSKTVPAMLRDLSGQIARGTFRFGDLAVAGGRLARAPRAASRLGGELRRLDLSPQMALVRRAGIPTTVIGCESDTLITPDHCRRAARLLGAEYRVVGHRGGHLWVFADPPALAEELQATLPP